MKSNSVCPCCGKEATKTVDAVLLSCDCDCTMDPTSLCARCHKCAVHCVCPEGFLHYEEAKHEMMTRMTTQELDV